MKFEDGGVTAAKGFMAAYTAAKIKYEGRDDMAFIYSEAPCDYAATFTKNVVKAACVRWDMDMLNREVKKHAIVVNSGIANAATGDEGLVNCVKTAEHVASVMGIEKDSVLVASTGVIGMQLPMDRLCSGIDAMKPALSDSLEAGTRAAQAIMTTDTCEKQICVSFDIGDTKVTIGGMAKGSGMIHPNMGTMLAFITTDVSIEQKLLQKALSEVVDETFNMVSVDGDTSTNDTCMVLANGEAKNKRISTTGSDYETFKEALFAVCRQLAMMIAGDGEGATALLEVKVINADTKANAKILAKSVVSSMLTKAAVFGHDANWGRIICALGYSGVDFAPEKVNISVESAAGKIDMAIGGAPAVFSEEEAKKIFSEEKVTFICNMNSGNEYATSWGCDLSYEYVKINADYRS